MCSICMQLFYTHTRVDSMMKYTENDMYNSRVDKSVIYRAPEKRGIESNSKIILLISQ